MAKKRSKGDNAKYFKLGDFIFDQNPYPKPVYPGSYKSKGIKAYGPGKGFGADHPYEHTDLRLRAAKRAVGAARASRILKEGVKLRIGNVERRMSKVIRIPYRHYDPDRKKRVSGALVICYEGAGGGS